MNRTRTARTLALGLVAPLAVVGSLVATAAPAQALTASATASVSGGSTTGVYNTYTGKLTVVTSDTVADGRCAYGAYRGYNHLLGWGSWKTLPGACGKGSSQAKSETISVYSDKIEVRVCVATCSVRRVWG